jgi:hypothetical protein
MHFQFAKSPPNQHRITHDNLPGFHGIVGVRGSTPLGSTKFFLPDNRSGSTLSPNPQDQHVILDIWRNGYSLHQVWDLYKLLQLTTSCRLSEAIEGFLKHLENRGRCWQYRYEFSRALKHLLKAMVDTLPVSQHTTKTLLMSCPRREQAPTLERTKTYFLWIHRNEYPKSKSQSEARSLTNIPHT